MKKNNLIYIVLLVMLASCENDIKTIKSFAHEKEVPVSTAENIEVLYSDSAKLKVRLVAPEFSKFINAESPYTEFPKGLTIYMYTDSNEVKTIIKARYVKYLEKTSLWHATNDVQVDNIEKNEHLNTEELFWNQSTGRIYSTKFSRIINSNGVFYGQNGFEADQELTKWKMIGISGTLNVKAQTDESTSP